MAGSLDCEQLVAIPDQAGRLAIRNDNTCPGIRHAAQLSSIRNNAVRGCTPCGRQQVAVRRKLQLEAAAQCVETEIHGTSEAKLLATIAALTLNAQSLQCFVVGQGDSVGRSSES